LRTVRSRFLRAGTDEGISGAQIAPCGRRRASPARGFDPNYVHGFAIDAVFLDRDLKVVEVIPNLRPWRLAGRRGARAILELPAGEASQRGIRRGDRLVLGEEERHKPAER
jgi:hypothetical protein